MNENENTNTDSALPGAPTQDAQPSVPSAGKKIGVMEIFGPTLQGEGDVIGKQTMFIRFAGCDYRCTMCDSLHAVLPELIKKSVKRLTVPEIYTQLESIAGHCKTVTFSGGNPLMWDLEELVDCLVTRGWEIHVETQGTLWHSWLRRVHSITVSPKGPGMGEKFELGKLTLFLRNQFHCVGVDPTFKVVIFDQRDIEFAKELANYFPDYVLYLSLGNPTPPNPLDGIGVVKVSNDQLMERMRVLWNDIAKEPLLAHARFLPQMHVLLWGNEQGR